MPVSYFFVFLTIFFTVYGQVVIKWQISSSGALPDLYMDKLLFLLKLLLNPWMVSAFAAAFVAAICWMAAMTKLHLSYAYPFMGLTFVLVLVLSGVFFDEPMNWQKTVCILLIKGGIALSSQG